MRAAFYIRVSTDQQTTENQRQALEAKAKAAGRAMFQMIGVFAEFEREMIRERVKAGMIRASAKGKHLGRPRKADAIAPDVQRLHGDGHSNCAVARQLGVAEGTVRRILAA